MHITQQSAFLSLRCKEKNTRFEGSASGGGKAAAAAIIT